MTEEILNQLKQIKNLLISLERKLPAKSNIHNTYTFDTSGTTSFYKDIHEILGLPKGHYATDITIFDIGGGFSFKINGEHNAITAVKNMTLESEEIFKVEFIPAGAAGTAKVRFGSYIHYE